MTIKRLTTSLREQFQTHKVLLVAKVLGFWVFFALIFVGLRHAELPVFHRWGAAAVGAVITVVVLIALSRLVRMEGETFADIGLRLGASDGHQFLAGTGLGLAVVALMIGVLLLLTPLEVQAVVGSNVVAILGSTFLILFALALMEEIVFRSYPIFRLQQAWGIRAAIYITSVAFAFYHGFVFESLLGPGVWGLLYGWMALKTNSIALPTGFHLGLNWGQAVLGMKPHYGDSIWGLSIGSGPASLGIETVGLAMQLILLVVGVILIERFVAKQAA